MVLTRRCHLYITILTIPQLKTTFDDEIISRNGPTNYPPRFCDSTPCDIFFWGYIRPQVYADNSTKTD